MIGELSIVDFVTGIIGLFVGFGAGYILGHTAGSDEEKERYKHVPNFQDTLITLSKIPGLEIKGEGIDIKGPEPKEEGEN